MTTQLLPQDSVVARDESERNIDLLIRDLQIAINDIADVGLGSVSEESQQEPPEPTEPIRKTEVLRNREATKRSQPLVSTRRDTERKSKPIGWVALQNRLQELYSRWTEARRSARSAVFAAISIHPSTNSASKSAPKRENHRVYLGSQDDLSTSRVGTAKRSGTARTASRSVKSAPLSRIDESSGYPTIQLSQILGISPAQSIGRAQDDVHDSLLSVALDLSRVHLLQQDLVNFSKSAFEFTHQIRSLSISTTFPSSSHSNLQDTSTNQSLSGITEDISFDQLTNLSLHSAQSTIPIHSKKPSHAEHPSFQVTTDSLLNYEESLNALRVQSRSLLLHLSCLAPLAPLSMGNTNGKNIQTSVGFYMPLSSSQTGLDLFIEMIIELLEPRKLLTPAIQRVIDRSKSEQTTLLNTIHECQKTTQKWKHASRESHSIFKNMTKSLNDIFRETIKDLQLLQNSLLAISRAWFASEQSRIQLPHSVDLVCPVEMLSRGYLGEEMASLMNTMKLYQHDLSQFLEKINFFKKRLQTEFNSSVVHSLLSCYQKFSELS
jgi:hypothetical protein